MCSTLLTYSGPEYVSVTIADKGCTSEAKRCYSCKTNHIWNGKVIWYINMTNYLIQIIIFHQYLLHLAKELFLWLIESKTLHCMSLCYWWFYIFLMLLPIANRNTVLQETLPRETHKNFQIFQTRNTNLHNSNNTASASWSHIMCIVR